MFVVGRPTATRLGRVLAEQAALGLTYGEVGATGHSLPDGYRSDEYELGLGSGAAVFERATLGLREWRAHRGAGLDVWPAGGVDLTVGETVLVVLPLAVVSAIAACRIVWVVDEPDAFGFGYGSLPAHPEQGEESFVIHREATGVVTFRIRAFSRPRDPLVRLGGPVSRGIQVTTTRRYLAALQRFVGE